MTVVRGLTRSLFVSAVVMDVAMATEHVGTIADEHVVLNPWSALSSR